MLCAIGRDLHTVQAPQLGFLHERSELLWMPGLLPQVDDCTGPGESNPLGCYISFEVLLPTCVVQGRDLFALLLREICIKLRDLWFWEQKMFEVRMAAFQLEQSCCWCVGSLPRYCHEKASVIPTAERCFSECARSDTSALPFFFTVNAQHSSRN